MDSCVRLGSAGILLTGWLFDPERLVSAVHLRGETAARRLDGDWVTRARPDAALAADARLAGYGAAGAARGFCALAADGAGGEDDELHLRLEIRGAAPLHVPLRARPGSPVPLLRRTLEGWTPTIPLRWTSGSATSRRRWPGWCPAGRAFSAARRAPAPCRW